MKLFRSVVIIKCLSLKSRRSLALMGRFVFLLISFYVIFSIIYNYITKKKKKNEITARQHVKFIICKKKTILYTRLEQQDFFNINFLTNVYDQDNTF